MSIPRFLSPNHIRGALAALALLACAATEAGAHCSESFIPEVRMDYPEDGTAIQTVCIPVLEECYVDTFHRAALQEEMVARSRAAKHAVIAYVDSVHNQLAFDTTFRRGEVYYIDTVQEESVWITIHAELKGSLPARRYALKERFIHIPGQPYATTYTALLDTPFVAFFDADTLPRSPWSFGIGPLDGCYFEATAYLVKDGHIHKRASDESARIPGVTVDFRTLLAAAGLPLVPSPPVRQRSAGLSVRRPRADFRAPGRTALPAMHGFRDLQGRLAPVGEQPYRCWRVGTPVHRP